MKIKAVVLDAYGTLFDVNSIQVLAEEFYPGQGAEIAQCFNAAQPRYQNWVAHRAAQGDAMPTNRWPH